MILYFVYAVLLVYAIYKERQALGCRLIPDGTDCDNANGKTVAGTKSYPDDSTDVLYQKLDRSIYAMQRFVVWRLCFILACASVLLIWALCWSSFPDQTQLVIGTMVIWSLLYFSFGFYNFHVWAYVQENATQTKRYLQGRCRRQENF